MTTGRTRVVFIHGRWLHATSWALWVELFRDAGRVALVRERANSGQHPDRRHLPRRCQ
jgi:hypothetical protein